MMTGALGFWRPLEGSQEVCRDLTLYVLELPDPCQQVPLSELPFDEKSKPLSCLSH